MKSEELDRKDRVALLGREALNRGVGVILLFEGPGIVAKNHALAKLAEILDPRHTHMLHLTHRIKMKPGAPLLHEFWGALPELGDTVFYDRSYYYKLAHALIHGELRNRDRDKRLQEIANFERTLIDNGYFIQRFYFHRSSKELKKDSKKKDDVTLSILKPRFKEQRKHYNEYRFFFDDLLSESKDWVQVESQSRKPSYRFVADQLVEALEARLGVDSTTAVAEFDRGMDRMRKSLSSTGEST